MDPYVINLPWLARKMIVSCFILPFRPKSTSEAYRKIWMDKGSPLLIFSKNLGKRLEEQFGIHVEVAMRYGRPSAENLPEKFDHLLFSYHSLPESQVKNSDPTGEHCLSHPNCCLQETSSNINCYRHQCIKTSDLISAALNIPKTKYSTSFQSKLGPVPWLTPSTEKTLISLGKSGVKQLVVACPSFVADNLETLEEIGDRGRETFIKAGGNNLTLVPCLNDRPDWVTGLGKILIDHSNEDAIEVTSA